MSAAGDVKLYMTLQKAAHVLRKRADQTLLEAAGLTTAQAAVLVVIHSEDGLATQRTIARALGLNESAITAMVTRLIAGKMIEKTRSKTDRRAWSLALTFEGERALSATRAPFEALNNEMDSAIGPKGIAALQRRLAELTDALSARTD